MLTLRSDVLVPGVTGRQITDFLLAPTDDDYQRWWPGTHLQFHVVRAGGPDHRGDVVRMDEFIGSRRLRMSAVVTGTVPGRQIVWRMGGRIPLPVRLTLDLSDRPGGAAVRHTITAGFTGIGRVLDPLLRLYFDDRFVTAMDAHAQQEFQRLSQLLTGPCGPSRP